MAKAPRPGTVKTRLCPPLLAPEAAALYRCFLLDKIAAVGALADAQPVIAYTPDDARAEFDGLAPGCGPSACRRGSMSTRPTTSSGCRRRSTPATPQRRARLVASWRAGDGDPQERNSLADAVVEARLL